MFIIQSKIKYFNSINGWRIESVQQEPSEIPAAPPAEAFAPATDLKSEDHDDLPF